MESLFVQNFKAIRNENGLTIPIKRLNILMGEQATGKSTFAKLVHFFKTLPGEWFKELVSTSQEKPRSNSERLTFRTRQYFVYSFGLTKHLDRFRIIYTYSSGQTVELRKDPRSGNLDVNLTGNGLAENINNLIHQYQQRLSLIGDSTFDLTAENERLRVERALGREIRELFGIRSTNVFMPASRNMTVVLEHILKEVYAKIENNLDAMSLREEDRFQSQNEMLVYQFFQYSEQLKKVFRRGESFEGVQRDREELLKNPLPAVIREILTFLIQKSQEVLRGQYRSDTYGEKIAFSDSGYVALGNASSGQQETIRLFQDLFVSALYQDPVFRVYEEPESHLHPRGQRAFMQAVGAMLHANPENQILLPTHSPYTLLALDNLLKARELADLHPELNERITEVSGVPAFARIAFSDVSAWFLENGEFISALSEERQGINADYVDQIAQEMEAEYDNLLSLEYDYADL